MTLSLFFVLRPLILYINNYRVAPTKQYLPKALPLLLYIFLHYLIYGDHFYNNKKTYRYFLDSEYSYKI